MQPESDAESEKFDAYFSELYRLMWCMVWDYANPDRLRLHPDDMFSELSLELWKVLQVYGNNGRSHAEIVKIAKVCLRNRCVDLYTMEMRTHRQAESSNISLDECNEDGLDMGEILPATNPDFSLYELLDGMTEDATQLVMLVLYPNDNLIHQIQLAYTRKCHVARKDHWQLQLESWMLRRALGWDTDRFDNAWTEVQLALAV